MRICTAIPFRRQAAWVSFLWGVTLVLVANTGYAGWSGGAADQEDNERSNVIMRPGDYPPGYSKHEIFHHSKTSTRHTFWETKTFTHTERGSGRSKQVDYKRIELMFWANFPCGFKKFSTMAQHGCRAADQVADNFQKGNLPQRPPNPLGDVSAVKTYQLTSCGSQKGITSRSLEFGFALGELLVRGRISGSTGSYGCDIYLPCPTYAELFQRLEVLAGIMRRYAKSAGMYKEEAGQSLAGQQHQSTPDTQVKEDQPSDQITPRGSKEAGGILPPWVPAAAGAAAGGVAAVGSLLTMLASGVRPREVWDGVKELLTQGPATEPEVVEEYSPEPDYEESAPGPEVVEECPPEEGFGEPQPETSQVDTVQEEDIMYQPPWANEPEWMSRSEYEDMQDKLSQGMTWTSGGWKTSEQLGQTERYRESLIEAARLKNEEIVRQQAEERYVNKMVENSRKIVRGFEDDYSRQERLQEFIDRQTAGGEMDPEESLQMYRALRNNLYESRQLLNESDRVYFEEVEKELTRKRDYVAQVREDAMRVNRLLAKFDPTGIGSRIVKLQGMTYAGIKGYEEGGLEGAVESMATSHLDGYTQGFATTNYQIIKDYAEGHPYLDKDGKVVPLKEALLNANLQQANDQWNVVDQVSKIQEGIRNGDLRQVMDSSMDLHDAKGDYEDFGNRIRGIHDRQPGEGEITEADSIKGPEEAINKMKSKTKIETEPVKPVRHGEEKGEILLAGAGKRPKTDLEDQRIKTEGVKPGTEEGRPLRPQEVGKKPDQAIRPARPEEPTQEPAALKPKADDDTPLPPLKKPHAELDDFIEKQKEKYGIEIEKGFEEEPPQPGVKSGSPPKLTNDFRNQCTVLAEDPKHMVDMPAMGGKHGKVDLEAPGDIRTSAGSKAQRVETIQHMGAKTKDPSRLSYTATLEKAQEFNREFVAEVHLPEEQINRMINSGGAKRVPYGKGGEEGSTYMRDWEMDIHKVPKENWKLSDGKPPAGVKLIEERNIPALDGYYYYRVGDPKSPSGTRKVYVFYRGLNETEIAKLK